jgi:SecD/SecF fusion protein
MTSLTTLIAILPMLIMCGEAIRAFVIPLIAGVVFGTVSSLCLATAFYFDLVRLTKKNRYKG